MKIRSLMQAFRSLPTSKPQEKSMSDEMKVVTPAAKRAEAGVMGYKALIKTQQEQIEVLLGQKEALLADIAEAKEILDELFPVDEGGSTGGVVG
jgi:hypothetical protein